MTRTHRNGAIVAFALLQLCAGGACGGRDSGLEEPLDLLGEPVALQNKLVFVDGSGDRAYVLDVSGKQPASEAQTVELPHAPLLSVRRNAKNEALILTQGRRADSKQEAEPAELVALSSSGKLRRYVLGNPFDRMVQSEDGRYALLFKSGSAERLLDNPNEIAVVDLDGAPGDKNPRLRTLRSFADSPLAAVYSPQMTIVGEQRRLLVVLSHKNVTLLDLDHLDRRETTVQLSSVNGQAAEPAQVVFSPDRPELYVRGAGSSDVFVFNLSERPGGTEDADGGDPHNDFRPSIDQLGVGGTPSDMKLYPADSGTRLLVLSAASQQASVVDADTSQLTNVALPTTASHVLLFSATSPRDNAVSTRALLYDDNASSLLFMDLADIEQRGSRNLEQVALDQPIVKLIAIPEERRVLVLHSQGVSLVDLAARTVSPLSSDRKLDDALFDAKHHRLWVGPAGQPFVGYLDLESDAQNQSGDTHELLLDASIDQLVPMFDDNRLAIVHDSPAGYVTLLDARSPSRETATSVRGFFLAGLLDRGE